MNDRYIWALLLSFFPLKRLVLLEQLSYLLEQAHEDLNLRNHPQHREFNIEAVSQYNERSHPK